MANEHDDTGLYDLIRDLVEFGADQDMKNAEIDYLMSRLAKRINNLEKEYLKRRSEIEELEKKLEDLIKEES